MINVPSTLDDSLARIRGSQHAYFDAMTKFARSKVAHTIHTLPTAKRTTSTQPASVETTQEVFHTPNYVGDFRMNGDKDPQQYVLNELGLE